MEDFLKGSVDIHIHCCPHINKRSTDILSTVEQAEKSGMYAIGLMDNFSNSSGYASLIKKILPSLKLKVFGGLIMEPPAGGVNFENVKIALNYGYKRNEGAIFISFPTHHTKFIAKQEKRKKSYIDSCFFVEENRIDDEILKILDLIAEKNIVLNTGHISGTENYDLVTHAKRAGVKKVLIPANNLNTNEIINLKELDVMFEFSYFFVSKATQIPLTHIDSEKNTINKLEINKLKKFINIIGTEKIILSSDCGVSVLPKPHLGFFKFITLVKDLGFSKYDLKKMTSTNPKVLFNI